MTGIPHRSVPPHSHITIHGMTDEPPSKRRRFTHNGAASDDIMTTFLPIPTPQSAPTTNRFDNIDPTLSVSPATSWDFDEFAHDPNYLASQEELRALLFTTARSAAPTRAGTPLDDDEDAPGTSFNTKQILARGRHAQHLKNYISQVAPWVPAQLPFLRIAANHDPA